MKQADGLSQNTAGYNGYFLETNLNALKKAKMPNYSKPGEKDS